MECSRRTFYACVALSLGNGLSWASSVSPSPKMPSLKLRNGVEMPIMSAGVFMYSVEEAQKSVEAALSVGFSHIDTAYDYDNQQGVAAGLKTAMAKGMARESIFVTTKIPGCGMENVSGVSVEKCEVDTADRIADGLRLLDAKYIDLMLIHFPPCVGEDGSTNPVTSTCAAGKTGCSSPKSCDLIRAQWRQLSAAYNAKQLRAVGVSNYCSACLKCLDSEVVQPMVNQVHLQVGMGPDPQGFKTYAQKQGIVLSAWSPLGLKWDPNGTVPILHGNLTNSIGKKHGKSAIQIALKWIVSQNLSVATKSSNATHLASNLDIFDFELDADDKQALDEADFAKTNAPSFLCNDEKLPLQVFV